MQQHLNNNCKNNSEYNKGDPFYKKPISQPVYHVNKSDTVKKLVFLNQGNLMQRIILCNTKVM